MAAREHKVSRRVLLAAACAAPLVRHSRAGGNPYGAGEGSWIPDQVRDDEEGKTDQSFAVTSWDRALARYRSAEAALAAGAGADDELFGRLLGRLNKALGRLLRTPAPNLPALATKLDLLVSHQVWELNFAERSLAAMRRDARRLAR